MKGSTGMKLFIFARFHAREGKESELASTLTTVSAATLAEPDCLRHQVFRSTNEPRLFFIHSQWTNEAAFERHIELPHTLRFVEHVEPLIDHELDVVRTRLVDAP
jgi:quinol monooxygenase YgiN